jgi:ubiquinone/menaquinone biosynthesis C-methylase UbiE
VSPHRWLAENARNVRIYSGLVRKYGDDVRALDWGSRSSQEKRFQVLEEIGCLNGASVLDVGCGLGDLYARLKANGMRTRYTGLDITPEMIEMARKRFPEAQFCVGDLLNPSHPIQSHDYLVSSGIFAKRRTAPLEFLKAMAGRMFRLSKRGVAFNCLSAWAEHKEKGEFYADPLKVLDYCRGLTPWVVLRHDYHPRDFTIYMYKAGKG